MCAWSSTAKKSYTTFTTWSATSGILIHVIMAATTTTANI
jgi:hypothetical protein